MRLCKKQLRFFYGTLLALWPGLLLLTVPEIRQDWPALATAFAQSAKPSERERERAYNRQLFKKTFHDIQILGQNLLKDHEAGRLTSGRLVKDVKAIHKCAKVIRSLTALGDLAEPEVINKDIDTPQEYDESIRLLAKHIWDFAHNPVLQNTKVFNTDQAQQAQTNLEAIMDLSKAIESRAKGYVTPAASPH
jgi:hypothetical protein